MLCPKCGGRSKVYDSRLAPNNRIRRDRKCMKCPVRFTTYEEMFSIGNEPGKRAKIPRDADRLRLREALVSAIDRVMQDA